MSIELPKEQADPLAPKLEDRLVHVIPGDLLTAMTKMFAYSSLWAMPPSWKYVEEAGKWKVVVSCGPIKVVAVQSDPPDVGLKLESFTDASLKNPSPMTPDPILAELCK